MPHWIQLLRSLFPSWRFFVSGGPHLQLEVRTGATPEAFSEWFNPLPPIRRSFRNLVINPEGNYLHACQNSLSHLLRLIADGVTPAELEGRAAYKITQNIVRFQLNRLQKKDPLYQFRLTLHSNHSSETALESPVYSQ